MSSESYGGSECSVECIVLTVRKVGNSYLENWLIERVNTRGVNERMQDTPQSQSSTGIEGCASKTCGPRTSKLGNLGGLLVKWSFEQVESVGSLERLLKQKIRPSTGHRDEK